MDESRPSSSSLLGVVAAHSVDLFRELLQLQQIRPDESADLEGFPPSTTSLANLIQKIHKYDELLAENEQLRNNKPAPTAEEVPNRVDNDHTDSKVSYESYDRLRQKYEQLVKEHDYMRRQAAQYKNALQKYKTAYIRSKESVRPWQEFADRMYSKSVSNNAQIPPLGNGPEYNELPKIPEVVSFGSSFSANQEDDEELKLDSKSVSPFPDISTSLQPNPPMMIEEGRARSVPPELLNGLMDGQICEENLSVHVPFSKSDKPNASSQTTDDGDKRNDGINSKEGNVEPDVEFVSTRPVKRRRRDMDLNDSEKRTTTTIYVPKGSSEEPIPIKEESSSSPINRPVLSQPLKNDSLDLDEISGAVETPRKARQLKRALSRMKSNGALHRFLDEWGNTDASDDDNVSEQAQNSTSKEVSRSNIGKLLVKNNQPVAGQARSTRVYVASPNLARTGDMVTPKSKTDASGSKNTSILKPLSVNRRVFPHTGNGNRGDGQAIKDGESGTITPLSTSRTLNRPVSNKNGSGNVSETSKNQQTPLEQTSRPSNPYWRGEGSATSNRTKPTSTVTKRNIRRQNRSPEGAFDTRPEDEPLRARSKETLRLEDFKVNPKANQGYSYAYDEVVRNQQQRRCLPGCTRPDCCGNQFRKIIEIGGALPVPPRNLWASTQDEQDEDQRLLEEFLGADKGRLLTMDQYERAELLKTARAHQLAQYYGKHRQVYERPQTPPGFWSTDMPGTQEQEEQRKRLKQFERERVDERYREAMRPNGRWMFRDE